MAQLLVSVRNPLEALRAAASGAEIIDLKEPAAGSLGQVSSPVREEILRQFGLQHPHPNRPLLSIALGELWDFQATSEAVDELSGLQAFRFAKVGLAAARHLEDWRTAWLALTHLLPPDTLPVAVAYADASAAESPEPEEVLEFAIEHSLEVFLLDTWSKAHGSLFQVLAEERLTELRQRALGRVRFAIAGSLSLDCEPQLRRIQPDVVALRGAVCVEGRNSPLSDDKVRDWKMLVSQLPDSPAFDSP